MTEYELLEQELTRSLERQLDGLDTWAPGPAKARATGRMIRRHRRLGTGALAAVVVLTLGGLALRPDPGRRAEPSHPVDPVNPSYDGTWTALPDLPIGPRAEEVVAWTGRQLVVVGGRTPQAPQAGSREGAAYRPDRKAWQRIADCPVALAPGSPSYATGRYLVVEAGQRWLAYDSQSDAWRQLPDPPLFVSVASAGAGRVYGLDVTDRVVSLNPDPSVGPGSGIWTALPADPGVRALRAAAGDDELTVTGFDGGVVVATTSGLADVWDGRRWETRSQPEPGRVVPATGEWQQLPPPPDGQRLFPVTDGTAGGAVQWAGQYLWDPTARRWLRPSPPPERVEVGTERIWEDGHLFQVGGLRVTADGRATSHLTDRAWTWTAAKTKSE